MNVRRSAALLLVVCLCSSWGFYGHRKINELAVYTLPPAMLGFYKKNQRNLRDAAVNPDRRRYAVAEEAARHYIDLDAWGDSAISRLPHRWQDAVSQYGADSLQRHGIVPWHLYHVYLQLKDAFLKNDPAAVLRLSADLGHYVADAHVPLHTTRNYDGQLTGQQGIHALWESRLPELFSDRYQFMTGRARYLDDVRETAWLIVAASSAAVDSVLQLERQLSGIDGRPYSFEGRGRQVVKVVGAGYARQYHELLNNMVERRMRASVYMTGCFWYTAWVDAGQPDLQGWISYKPTAAELAERKQQIELWKHTLYPARPHEQSDNN
ncbi:MAG: S1/P1 Nuclease [Cyclobacteriaceae bacterium]|nr:S1/P1 Nuclease [Cyclobacteriaceae bacterium]